MCACNIAIVGGLPFTKNDDIKALCIHGKMILTSESFKLALRKALVFSTAGSAGCGSDGAGSITSIFLL